MAAKGEPSDSNYRARSKPKAFARPVIVSEIIQQNLLRPTLIELFAKSPQPKEQLAKLFQAIKEVNKLWLKDPSYASTAKHQKQSMDQDEDLVMPAKFFLLVPFASRARLKISPYFETVETVDLVFDLQNAAAEVTRVTAGDREQLWRRVFSL
jgi:hypothetical protein